MKQCNELIIIIIIIVFSGETQQIWSYGIISPTKRNNNNNKGYLQSHMCEIHYRK